LEKEVVFTTCSLHSFSGMQDSSKRVVHRLLTDHFKAFPCETPQLLDAPYGDGWLKTGLTFDAAVDGIDLYTTSQDGYRVVFKADLDAGIPSHLSSYAAILCCEGLEHFGNPLLFLETAHQHLEKDGLLVITTPNIWYPAARLQYLIRGFFPSFPCLAGKIIRGSHMHIMPWSFPQLYLYLKLAGFTDIALHEEPLSKAKHFWEKIVVWPQILYCRNRLKRTSNQEEADFWRTAVTGASLFGRHLIVTARPGESPALSPSTA
jgi:SAM-dependent methyltransferase